MSRKKQLDNAHSQAYSKQILKGQNVANEVLLQSLERLHFNIILYYLLIYVSVSYEV